MCLTLITFLKSFQGVLWVSDCRGNDSILAEPGWGGERRSSRGFGPLMLGLGGLCQLCLPVPYQKPWVLSQGRASQSLVYSSQNTFMAITWENFF